MKNRRSTKGFTLAELLVALMVTAIIMSAVVSLAFALGQANEMSTENNRSQAQVRYASLKLSDLIRNSRMICAAIGDDIVLWKADDNPANGEMDITELAYIELGSGRNQISLLEFEDAPWFLDNWFLNSDNQIEFLDIDIRKTLLKNQCEYSQVVIIEECSNAAFLFDEAPPQSKFVTISFDLEESDAVSNYQISGAVRCWAGHMLNNDGTDIVSEDDL